MICVHDEVRKIHYNCTFVKGVDQAGSSRVNLCLARRRVSACGRTRISNACACTHLMCVYLLAAALKRDIIGLSRTTCLLQTIARSRGGQTLINAFARPRKVTRLRDATQIPYAMVNGTSCRSSPFDVSHLGNCRSPSLDNDVNFVWNIFSVSLPNNIALHFAHIWSFCRFPPRI